MGFREKFLELKSPDTIMIAYGCLDLIIKMNSSISFRNFFEFKMGVDRCWICKHRMSDGSLKRIKFRAPIIF
jgi:hypothetical protein